MIVDSLWFYPILGVVLLAVLYWIDHTWALIQFGQHRL